MSTVLNEWLGRPGNTIKFLVRETQIDHPCLSRLRRGAPISIRNAILLEKASGGDMRAEDLVSCQLDYALIKHIKEKT